MGGFWGGSDKLRCEYTQVRILACSSSMHECQHDIDEFVNRWMLGEREFQCRWMIGRSWWPHPPCEQAPGSGSSLDLSLLGVVRCAKRGVKQGLGSGTEERGQREPVAQLVVRLGDQAGCLLFKTQHQVKMPISIPSREATTNHVCELGGRKQASKPMNRIRPQTKVRQWQARQGEAKR